MISTTPVLALSLLAVVAAADNEAASLRATTSTSTTTLHQAEAYIRGNDYWSSSQKQDPIITPPFYKKPPELHIRTEAERDMWDWVTYVGPSYGDDGLHDPYNDGHRYLAQAKGANKNDTEAHDNCPMMKALAKGLTHNNKSADSDSPLLRLPKSMGGRSLLDMFQDVQDEISEKGFKVGVLLPQIVGATYFDDDDYYGDDYYGEDDAYYGDDAYSGDDAYYDDYYDDYYSAGGPQNYVKRPATRNLMSDTYYYNNDDYYNYGGGDEDYYGASPLETDADRETQLDQQDDDFDGEDFAAQALHVASAALSSAAAAQSAAAAGAAGAASDALYTGGGTGGGTGGMGGFGGGGGAMDDYYYDDYYNATDDYYGDDDYYGADDDYKMAKTFYLPGMKKKRVVDNPDDDKKKKKKKGFDDDEDDKKKKKNGVGDDEDDRKKKKRVKGVKGTQGGADDEDANKKKPKTGDVGDESKPKPKPKPTTSGMGGGTDDETKPKPKPVTGGGDNGGDRDAPKRPQQTGQGMDNGGRPKRPRPTNHDGTPKKRPRPNNPDGRPNGKPNKRPRPGGGGNGNKPKRPKNPASGGGAVTKPNTKKKPVGSSVKGIGVMQWSIPGSMKDLSSLGQKYGVNSCSHLDFLTATSVFAFGFQEPGQEFGIGQGRGICVAFNPCRHTYGLGQTAILPPIQISSLISITIDALGFSLHKDLMARTLNSMWEGGNDPPAYMYVKGHVVLKATGDIGFKLSPKFKLTISIDTTILIDADPMNNGIGQVLRDSEEDQPDVDFAVLLSGSAGPQFEMIGTGRDGTSTADTINLASLITVDADIYTLIQGEDSRIALAASLNFNLGGICAMSLFTAPLCLVFDGMSKLSGAVRAFANKGGFGIMFSLEGYLAVAYDIWEPILKWPKDGKSFYFDVSVEFTGGALEACFRKQNHFSGMLWNPEDYGKQHCIATCKRDSQCADNKFCNLLGFCEPKHGIAHICHKNSVCKSGFCVAGFCSECPKIDTLKGCYNATDPKDPRDQFCTQDGFKLGYRCVPQKGQGGACLSDVACKSGHCVGGFCSECPKLDSSKDCKEDEFCGQDLLKTFGLFCKKKLDLGGACLSSNVCKSGLCKGGFCCECPAIDSLENCPKGKFCTQKLKLGYRCETQRKNGNACSSGNACKSGICKGGFCSECPKIDSSEGCPADKFCTQKLNAVGYRCVDRKDNGGTCSSKNACKSKRCVAGFCSECSKIDSQDGCPSHKFCTQDGLKAGYRCVDKWNNGKGICLKDVVCKSGNCVAGTCGECPKIDKTDGCPNGKVCIGTLKGLKCQDKRNNGEACLSGTVCKSGKCDVGFCRECTSHSHCGSGKFCDFWKCQNKKNNWTPCGFKEVCKSNKCCGLCC